MEYLGHYDAETGREQLLKEHLDHVASLAAQFAAAFDAEELGEIAGLYHDIGKYSARFQAYLRGERGSGGDHSTGGAQLLYQKRQPQQERHHGKEVIQDVHLYVHHNTS